METLRKNLLYLNVSDVKMEEGSMRCDVNISLSKDKRYFGNKDRNQKLELHCECSKSGSSRNRTSICIIGSLVKK